MGPLPPEQPKGSTEGVRARIDSVGNWNRVLNRWSLDSDSPTEANNSFSDSDPVSAYVTDAAIYPPRRDIAIPSASGTYTYTWEWQNAEQKYIGTWTVTENMAGVVTVLGQFDLRMLALKNSRAVPASFDPALPDQTEGSSTTLRADVVALPFSSENDPDGWRPTGPVDWKISITNSDSTLVKTLTGSVNVTVPDSTGKIAEITTPWRGEQNGTATTLPGGPYSFTALALGPLGTFANTRTRPATGNVSIGDQRITIAVPNPPESFDPSSGGSTTLSFDLSTEGLGDSPEIKWTVSAVATGTNTITHNFIAPGAHGPGTVITYWENFAYSGLAEIEGTPQTGLGGHLINSYLDVFLSTAQRDDKWVQFNLSSPPHAWVTFEAENPRRFYPDPRTGAQPIRLTEIQQ